MNHFSKFLSIVIILSLLVLGIYGCNSSSSDDEDTKNAWSWIFPQPQGNTLRAVWTATATSTYAVGEAGTILHYNGTDWKLMENPETNDLLTVWGASDACVFAGGSKDGILKWDGETWSWSKEEDGEGNQTVTALFGFTEYDVYAGSGSGLMHFDGLSWNLVEDTPFGDGEIGGIWGTSGDDLHLAYKDQFWHYDGTDWSLLYDISDGSVSPTFMWGTSENDIYCTSRQLLQGNAASLYHFNGTEWTWVQEEGDLDYQYGFCGIWGTGADDIYVTGSNSVLYHWDGQTWTYIQGGAQLWTYGISGFDDDLFFLVGDAGVLYEVKDGQSSFARTEFFSYLLDAYVTQQGELYALADSNVYTMGEEMPEEIDLPFFDYPLDLSGITGNGEELYIAGHYETDDGDNKGIVYKYDGAQWTILSSEIGEGLFSSIWTDGSVLFVAASNGHIYSYADEVWEDMVLPVQVEFTRIWGTSQSDVYAVGASGTVLYFDGTTWSQVDAGTGTYKLFDIWASSPDDVYVAGQMGTVRHFDGSAWTDVDLGDRTSTRTISCICGRSASDVLFIDGSGRAYSFDGQKLVSSRNIASSSIKRMTTAGDGGDIYAVGNLGTIVKNSVK